MLKTMRYVFNHRSEEMVSTVAIFRMAAYIVLGAAILSSIFWVGLSYTWWKLERKRVKKIRENDF